MLAASARMFRLSAELICFELKLIFLLDWNSYFKKNRRSSAMMNRERKNFKRILNWINWYFPISKQKPWHWKKMLSRKKRNYFGVELNSNLSGWKCCHIFEAYSPICGKKRLLPKWVKKSHIENKVEIFDSKIEWIQTSRNQISSYGFSESAGTRLSHRDICNRIKLQLKVNTM